jgi:hypothetical protein
LFVTYKILVLDFIFDLLAVFGDIDTGVLANFLWDVGSVQQSVFRIEVIKQRVVVWHQLASQFTRRLFPFCDHHLAYDALA